jgi:glycine/D-amino acid oxidase-like deaminating enzyme
MPTLLVVGGGLFGSLAASYARCQGIESAVFDAALDGAASPAAAGLFRERWVRKNLREHYHRALPLLDRLFGIRLLSLTNDEGQLEPFLFVSPADILEKQPIRQQVTAVGDGWLEAGGRRYEGWVYVAAGVWSDQFLPGLDIYGKAGAAFLFRGERPARIHPLAQGGQALAFVRDPGFTYFSDGTAEREYTQQHDIDSLRRAAEMGLSDLPFKRYCGWRPYTPGGPVFRKMGERTWLATGGRKLGTILAASFALQLVERELS